MGEKRLPFPSFGLASKGQGGQGPLTLSLLYLLIWESQHPEDKFPWGEEPLGAYPDALGVAWAAGTGQGQQGVTKGRPERKM